MLLADSGTKIVSMVRNRTIRVVKIVVNNTNFDSFLVVKKVLCFNLYIDRHENSTQCALQLTMVRNSITKTFIAMKHAHKEQF